MNGTEVLVSILVIAAVTALTRFLPYLLFSGRQVPEKVLAFGRLLPGAVMGMLVVYCLRGVSFSAPAGFLPELIAGAVTVGTYVLKKNTLLSIVSGTACYMLLIQLVFR